ncbi:hypothetical protein TIFTF001_025768 [Ficus carica]|uniref:MYND-type domain-containing protein n=1 Tax=Ficus carica TaxID=3494 RepID=A0AA88AX82_FICCA|nr:hypothetical protein TIFTF001_025768 [Ficus carica]
MAASQRKKLRTCRRVIERSDSDFFDGLPDDLVVCILGKLSASTSSPSDFSSILLTCKRFNRLGLHPLVLSKASRETFGIRAANWSDSAHRFLKQCAAAGNVEAWSGASLMAKAAIKSHAPALYSLAVIQFNGSGGSKSDKDLSAGVALCARAAFLGHVDALRELGHCLQDGYGVRKNVTEGRRLLVQANARELVAGLRSMTWQSQPQLHRLYSSTTATTTMMSFSCPLLSDFGCSVPAPAVHPANRFLKEWFGLGRGGLGQKLRLCAHGGCGRPETRPHEFRRCSVCGKVNYCSRGCQALDWKVRHKAECSPYEQRWLEDDAGVGENGGHGGGGGLEMVEGEDDGENVIIG